MLFENTAANSLSHVILFAKLGISKVGMTDNGPNECSSFTKYCNCVHVCLDTVYPVYNYELKMVLSSFNVSER